MSGLPCQVLTELISFSVLNLKFLKLIFFFIDCHFFKKKNRRRQNEFLILVGLYPGKIKIFKKSKEKTLKIILLARLILVAALKSHVCIVFYFFFAAS